MKKIMVVFGTRPEAIKLAPIILELKRRKNFETIVCVTAQHREMLDQVLGLFGIKPDIDLNIMTHRQTLPELTSRVLLKIDQTIADTSPNIVLVQGDTTTVMATAMAAFYRRVQVGHVEAGLRSRNLNSPFPEEMNRRVATLASNLHFAPTKAAVNALRSEGIPEDTIFLTGNPVIDALNFIVEKPAPEQARELLQKAGVLPYNGQRKLILVTAHRRENFGSRFESICRGLKDLALRNSNVVIIYPVHLNPNVQEPVREILGNTDRVILTEPVTYDTLAHLMKACYLVLTDSGGIQEEAPSLGKPALVMRTETERPEGIEAGTAKLVGPIAEKIVSETEKLLYDEKSYIAMSKAINPYGDGKASLRIVEVLASGRLSEANSFGGEC